MVTTQRLLAKRRDVARRFLKSYVEAIHVVKTNPELSKKAFAKYRQTQDEKRLEDAYQALREIVKPKPYPSLEGLKTIIEDASDRIPAGKTANPKDFIDVSVLEELDRSGTSMRSTAERFGQFRVSAFSVLSYRGVGEIPGASGERTDRDEETVPVMMKCHSSLLRR